MTSDVTTIAVSIGTMVSIGSARTDLTNIITFVRYLIHFHVFVRPVLISVRHVYGFALYLLWSSNGFKILDFQNTFIPHFCHFSGNYCISVPFCFKLKFSVFKSLVIL